MHPIDYFWRSARNCPDNVAIISPSGQMTYGQLALAVSNEAASLSASLNGERRTICIGAKNSVDHLIQILAVLAAGQIWVPLNPRNGDSELRRIVEFVNPAAVYFDAPMAERLPDVPAPHRVLGEGDEKAVMSASARMGPSSRYTVPLDETQAIKFTGGTTGTPKGVMQPLRAWNTNIVTQICELKLVASDRYLVAAPLTHGTSTYMLPILAVGGALIFPDETTPCGLLEAAERHDASILFAPPTLIFSLMGEQAKRPRPLPSLRYLIYGGAPMRPEKIAEAKGAFGDVLCTCYGQTEAPQIITFLPPDEMSGDLARSVGRPTVLTQLATFSEAGERLPYGEEGEIAVRGDLVMTGYFKTPDETRKVFIDGWLRTGDVGVIDDRGYLFLRDRLRDVIITGGFNVYPSDVELAISQYPGIADCSVVGVPDAKWGEAVHAAIQPREGCAIDAGALIATVKHQLGSVKAPKQVHLFETLPRSAVGKTMKTAIRSEIMRREGLI